MKKITREDVAKKLERRFIEEPLYHYGISIYDLEGLDCNSVIEQIKVAFDCVGNDARIMIDGLKPSTLGFKRVRLENDKEFNKRVDEQFKRIMSAEEKEKKEYERLKKKFEK